METDQLTADAGTGTIHELDKQLSQRICTGQVVISLAGACRELIDNALDAGATNIEIRTSENGLETLEIIDNGSGISPYNFDRLCKPHCTSKLAVLDDFQSLTSFGFRGEALNALASLSDLQITTRDSASQCATRLSFGRNGELLSKEQCPRSQGTTVRVANIFKPLPVRRQELQRQARREFLRLIDCVQAFALSRTDCRFTLFNTLKGKRSQILSTPGGPNCQLPDVLSSLFGTNGKNGNDLLNLDEVPVPSEECCQLYGAASTSETAIFSQIKLSGFISNCESGHGRSSADRQFIFVNRRHVDFPKLCRIANEVYSTYNRGRYCTLVLFVDVPPATLDVNISPDKRTVFLHHEKEVFAKLRASLVATFARRQGSCPVGASKSQQALAAEKTKNKKRQIATLLRWKDSLEVKREVMVEEERDQQSRNYLPVPTQQSCDLSYLHFEEEQHLEVQAEEEEDAFGGIIGSDINITNNQAVIIEAVHPINDNNKILENEIINTEEEEQQNEEEAGEEEDEFAQILLMSSSDEEENGEGELDDSILAVRSFNPDDSSNLHDSFVLAATPSAADKSQHNPAQKGINAPIDAGFVSAASLLQIPVECCSNQEKNRDENRSAKCGKSPENKRSRLIGPEETPRRKKICGHSRTLIKPSTAQKALEAFSFQCLRPGGMDEVLRERQIQSEKEQTTSYVEPAEISVVDDKDRDEIIQMQPSKSQLMSSQLSPSQSAAHHSPSASQSGLYRPQQHVEVDMEMLERNLVRRNKLKKKLTQSEEDDRTGVKLQIRIPQPPEINSQGEEDTEAVERRLSLMLKKSDFARMCLIGQFNSAFILARLDAEVFIIDQHAADEKFNFERLMAKCIIRSQQLIHPQRLQLGSVCAGLLRDNLHIFQANGFDFKFCGQNDEEEILFENDQENRNSENCGDSVLLTAVPVHHGWQLNRDDIDQMLSMVAEMPGTMHRPQKVRKIFASKACRYSTMFGKALTRREMETIIRHMGTMDQPWNCPHGRPTIRHLCTLEKK